MSTYTEEEIAKVVLRIIDANPGIHTSALIAEARRIMKPTGEDLDILNNRSDDKFSQKVRNLKSHNSIAHLVETVGERDRQWYLKK